MRMATLAHSNEHYSGRSAFAPRPPVTLTPVLSSPWRWAKAPEPISQITKSVSAKIQEKYASDSDQVALHLAELNRDVFWSQYSTLDQLASVETKTDIMKIISTFEFIGKKSVFLFSIFARKIVANRHMYSANELAEIMHAFAHLGFLEESFCLQLSERLIQDLDSVSPQSFVYIADAFASTRCFHAPLVDALLTTRKELMKMLSVGQTSLLLSSLARLNVRNEPVFELLGNRLIALTRIFSPVNIFTNPEEVEESPAVTARDVTLTAYAYGKMNVALSHKLTETIVCLSKQLVRDFTAKELQMLMTAFDRMDLSDVELFAAVSVQAQRRMAQFSCESLVHFLRAMSNRKSVDSDLVTRIVCQLPRLVTNMKAAELVALYQVFRDMGLQSRAAMEALRASTVSKAGQLSSGDWLTVLGSAVEIAKPEMVIELLEAFALVNSSPANYRSTTTIINATIISRMTAAQLGTLALIVGKSHNPPPSLLKTISQEVERRSWTPSDASDVYCALVKGNMHEKSVFEGVMRNLFTTALHAYISLK
jgi:hypothetical protein